MNKYTAIPSALFVIFTIGLGVFLWAAYHLGGNDGSQTTNFPTPPTTTSVETTTTNVILNLGAVATASDDCTDIAVNILKSGGNAIDAAVSATFCQGLTIPQSTGVGGGFLATIYIKSLNKIETLNAREVAPLRATRDMYNDPSTSSSEGGLSIAVPTEVKGLWELHQKYGKLSWASLIEPVIEVAENGFKVNNYLASALIGREDKIRNYERFS